MEGKADKIKAIRDAHKSGVLTLDEAIERILALHRPGGITREGAVAYLESSGDF